MKRILFASAVTAALAFSAQAFADSGTGPATVNISANVALRCSVSSTTHTVDLNDLSDSSGAVASVTSGTQHFGDIWCNGSHNSVTVTATPLTNSATSPDRTFVNFVDYQVTTTNPGLSQLGPLNTVGGTTGSPKSISASDLPAFDTGGTNFDQYTITTTADATHKPIAGAYTAVITVSVAPGL